MGSYLGSANSRYCGGVREGRLFLARDDTVVWEKQLPFDIFQLVGLGTNGQLLILGPPGLFSYKPAAVDPPELIQRWSREELAGTGSIIGGIRSSADGRSLCVQRTTKQSRTSQKIFQLLSSQKVQPNSILHEVLFHDLVTDEISFFYRTVSAGQQPQRFLWDISVDFEWIVMAESQKGDQMKVTIANVGSQTIYQEFALPPLQLNGMRVDPQGTAILDIVQGDQRGLLVVTAEGKRSVVSVPTDFRILHLGADFVAMETFPNRFLLVKGHDDNVRQFADLRPLERLGMDFHIHFNQHDAIDVMTVSGDDFKVLHTNLDFIETDAKRWQNLAESLDELPPAPVPVEAPRRPHRLEVGAPFVPVIEPPPAEPPTMRTLEIETKPVRPAVERTSHHPTAPVEPQPEPIAAPPGPPDEAERRRVQRLLELLEERFILGQVTEQTYVELGRKYRERLGEVGPSATSNAS